MTKVCSKCDIEKDVSQFGKLKRNNDGYRQRCKACRKDDEEKYKEKSTEYNKKWRKDNKRLKAELDRDYYEKNKEKILTYAKKWRKENKELNNSIIKKWKDKNPSFKIHHRFSSLVYSHMKRYLVEGKGNSSWVNFVDYNVDDLISYLGEDLFKKGYDIDHIIPVSLYSFKSYTDEEFKKCWDIRNLRVIAKKENISKGNSLDMGLVEENKIYDLLPEGMV